MLVTQAPAESLEDYTNELSTLLVSNLVLETSKYIVFAVIFNTDMGSVVITLAVSGNDSYTY